jgi:GNAT superfamily N-acetyltransferase
MQVRSMTPHDVGPTARTLAAAFQGDPVWDWIFGDPVPEPDLRARWWAQYVRAAVAAGTGRVADDGGAVTLWLPPGAPELLAQDEARADRLAAQVLGERGALMPDIYATFDQHRPRREHQYLDVFATHPASRGRGVGMALLRADLAELDAIGRPAYLESSNPANLARYESVGFVRLERFVLPGGGPAVDTMWRDPSRGSS